MKLLLDFAEPMMLRDGDGLVLEDGSVVVVAGQAEALVEISAQAPLDFVRLAWHIGNRHTDVQFADKAFRIRRDHVLEEMVKGLGAVTSRRGGAVRSRAGARRTGMHAPTHDHDGERSTSALYRLMAWLSPAYPVGAFSYSSGIEWAVESGDISERRDAASAGSPSIMAEGGGFCDAVFFVHAHRAVAAGDDKALRDVAELAAAFAPSKERHLETTAQGRAFVEATRAAWPCAALDRLAAVWDGPVAYPVAVGVAAAGHGVAVEPALDAYLHAVTANLDLGRRAAHPARPDRRPAPARGVRAGRRRDRRARARRRRSIRSAARRFAPTSPACATKRSTRGCSVVIMSA